MLENFYDLEFALDHWEQHRPFFTMLSPEYAYDAIRPHILQEVEDTLITIDGSDFSRITYYTYPDERAMEKMHENSFGAFFSEIREEAGFKAAISLSELAVFLRLEHDQAESDKIWQVFSYLWQAFSRFKYGHGYDTPSTRNTLTLLLGSNNILELVEDKQWFENTRRYFETNTHPWGGKPLVQGYPAALRILGGEIHPEAKMDSPLVNGILDLSKDSEFLERNMSKILWERSASGKSIFGFVGIGSTPSSYYYHLPYHMTIVKSAR